MREQRHFINTFEELQRPENWLSGGGEMGARIRKFDWAATAIGTPDTWSTALRTVVRMLLANRFPLLLWWGPEYISIYNDAYRPILGQKHPWGLGRPVRECWSEIWDVLKPLIDTPFHGGAATWLEDIELQLNRAGFTEETHFTVAYSPVPDETVPGGIGGVLATVHEITAKVIGERRGVILRDLGNRSAEAKTAEEACATAAATLGKYAKDIPFALIYLTDPDGTTIRLAASCGVEQTPTIDNGVGWPLAAAQRSEEMQVVDDLKGIFTNGPGGTWPEPPHTAVVLPIRSNIAHRLAGFLVVGLSSHQKLDESYKNFLDLATSQIATAISNARAFEAERQRAEALAEIDKAKTAFFGNVSHEFRTPLTLLLGPTEDALRRPIPSLNGENLQIVHRNALRLLKLVNSLLDFSRIEAGRVQAVYQPTDLAAFTEDLVSGFRSAVERAGLSLTFNVTAHLPAAFVDRQMWEKIVLNLMSNAFKFTFEGGIHVRLTNVRENIELSVSDTGVGIPEKELPHLFERFHRVQGTRSRTHEGTGIGLALVQELVRLHGGTIHVNSRVDQGSTFTVSIPSGSSHLQQDHVADEHVLSSTALGVAAFREEALRWIDDDSDANAPEDAAAGARGRILIADDNADMRSYLTRILSSRWSVETAVDGAAALKAARQHKPDVVLTDIMMPGLDGFELLRSLRSDPSTRDVRVVLLSARAGEESRIEGLDAGADDYLVKPFSARELMARINSQLVIANAQRTALEHRNELYSLFMQAPAPICVIGGEDLRFEMANALYLKVAGRADVVGKTLLEVFPEIRGHGFDEMLLEVMRTSKPFLAREMLVRLDRGRGVEDIWFTFIYAPLTSTTGQTDRVMCFCNEVTDQVIARREAEKASRAKDEFLAILGHELRNPLAPIVTALHLMKENPNFEMGPHIIEKQVKYMVRLVDDLLDVARITRGKIQLHKKPTELASIVSHAVDIAAPMIEERAQELHVMVPKTGLAVLADEIRLAQVVANLLTNASKFTPSGRQIHIKASAQNEEVQLSIADDGKGISPELLPRIFEIFVQGDRPSDESRAGLGLGLSIVKSFTELHGGRVSVQSAGEGKGSEFTITLPLVNPALLDKKTNESETPATAQQPANRQRVLIVDDNRDSAEMMGVALEFEGHEVRLAFDGPSAVTTAMEYKPTVVLLDIGLPVLDGYEVARRLRSIPVLRGVRLLAVSGYGLESDRRKTTECGFDLHLVKPVNISELSSILKQWPTQITHGPDLPVH